MGRVLPGEMFFRGQWFLRTEHEETTACTRWHLSIYVIFVSFLFLYQICICLLVLLQYMMYCFFLILQTVNVKPWDLQEWSKNFTLQTSKKKNIPLDGLNTRWTPLLASHVTRCSGFFRAKACPSKSYWRPWGPRMDGMDGWEAKRGIFSSIFCPLFVYIYIIFF